MLDTIDKVISYIIKYLYVCILDTDATDTK